MELSINAVVCQNHRIADNGCQKCSEVCSSKAIEVIDGKVQLGSGSCAECGLCRAVCPTKAIDFNNESRYPLKKQAGKQAVYCRRLNENGYVSCLGCLDAVEIILLGMNGQSCIYLDREFCQQCNAQVLPYFKKELVRANIFLESIGYAPVKAAFTKKAVVSGMDRRDVLGLLFTKARQQISEAIPIAVNRISLRKQLAERLTEEPGLTGMQNDNIFFGIANTLDCTLCGLCAKVCTSGALQLVMDKQSCESRLEFRADSCNGCGSCVKLCQQGCLKIGGELCTVEAVINDKSAVIGRLPMRLCTKCGQQLVRESEKLCPVCQAAQKNKMQAIY